MSEEDKKSEEIRALLRKKLEGLPPAEDGWNVPSPRVWSGMSEELDANRQAKQNKGLLGLLATVIAALLVIFCWRECSNQQQLAILKSEVETVNTAYGKLQAACDEKVTTDAKAAEALPGNAEKGATNGAAAGNAAASQTGEPETHFYPKKTTANPSKTKTSSAETTKITEVQKEAPITALTNFTNEPDQVGSEGVVQKTASPEPLSFPSLSKLLVPETSPKLSLHLPNPKNASPATMLIASLHGGLALTGNRLSGDKPAIIQGQKPLLAWRAGLGLELAFNRQWSVLTGVDYNVSRIETDYQLAVPYRHSGETQHDDGNFDNQYNHSLPSPLGNYPAQLVLTRTSNSVVEEGEVMNLELKIRQQTRFVSLPLQLRYGFGKHRWMAGAKAGIMANHAVGVTTEMPKLVSLHGAIHERHTSIGAPALSDLNKWTLDYTLGLDLRYQLSPRFGLSISTAYQRGITPVYQDDAVKNHLHSWNLGGGVLFWLR